MSFSVPLNRLFLGNPGTGKTTIAKIYGRILKALNFLEKGDVVFKSASDFLGSAIGESERKTAAILELAQENVLIVDEAYAMDDQMFGKRALDTFVEKLQGEGIAVVLIGYEAEMKAMFRNQVKSEASAGVQRARGRKEHASEQSERAKRARERAKRAQRRTSG
jgi:adenylate kinase family enzyme